MTLFVWMAAWVCGPEHLRRYSPLAPQCDQQRWIKHGWIHDKKIKKKTHTHTSLLSTISGMAVCWVCSPATGSLVACNRRWQARSFTLRSSSLESFHLVLLGPFLLFLPHNPVTNRLSSSCDEGASSLGRYLWTLPPLLTSVSLFHLSSVKWFQQLTELTWQFGRFFERGSHLKK